LNIIFCFLQDKIAAIHEAVENGSLEELKTNLTRKKYALAKDRQTGASILHKAVVYGHLDIVRYYYINVRSLSKY
jgi:hypothetical protein